MIKKPHFVVYTNTEFIDICNIQTNYLSNFSKTLLINSNNMDLGHIYSQYDDVIFYDDQQLYSSRLLNLSKLKDKHEFILLIHDIDVVLHYDTNTMDRIMEILVNRNIDRIDLQLDGNPPNTVNWMEHIINIDDNTIIDNRGLITDDEKIFLSYNKHGGYIYNVNPSIWKLESLISILTKFPNHTYRSIESDNHLQSLMSEQFKTYQLYTIGKRRAKCGYFVCLDFFQFLHITHGGRLIPTNEVGQHYSLSDFAFNEYSKIYEKYLFNTKRLFRKGMSEHEI